MTDLSVENLTLCAGAMTLVESASFNLAQGEFVALLGPNGAGKTSLIRAGIGLQSANDGRSLLDGTPVHGLSPAQRARQIAYLPQIRPLA